MWSFWLKNQNSANFAPLFCALGRRTRPQKRGQHELTGDRRLDYAPVAAKIGRKNATEISLFWSFFAAKYAVPKRRNRTPFWSQQSLTQFGAPVLRPRAPNRAPKWPDGAKKCYAIFYGISCNGQSKKACKKRYLMNNYAHNIYKHINTRIRV